MRGHTESRGVPRSEANNKPALHTPHGRFHEHILSVLVNQLCGTIPEHHEDVAKCATSGKQSERSEICLCLSVQALAMQKAHQMANMISGAKHSMPRSHVPCYNDRVQDVTDVLLNRFGPAHIDMVLAALANEVRSSRPLLYVTLLPIINLAASTYACTQPLEVLCLACHR
jgi:hypothetical protein